MKLQAMSDVHLEFGDFNPKKVGDILLLAGDVCVVNNFTKNGPLARKHNKRALQFFEDFCGKFDKTYLVLGNHEYYGGVYEDVRDVLEKALVNINVLVLENEGVRLNDTHVLWGGTFWTDFDRKNWFATQAAQRGMADYEVVWTKKGPLTTDFVYDLNQKARYALMDALKTVDKKFVVMTHHGLVVPPREELGTNFANNNLDFCYFNVGMEEALFGGKVTHYVHGHTHDTYDYVRHNVRVMVNPRGYHGYAVNKEFKDDFYFEV